MEKFRSQFLVGDHLANRSNVVNDGSLQLPFQTLPFVSNTPQLYCPLSGYVTPVLGLVIVPLPGPSDGVVSPS